MISFSITKQSIVLIAQTNEITKILAKGICLSPNGYIRDKMAVEKIVTWVLNLKLKKRNALIIKAKKVKKQTAILFLLSQFLRA